MRMPIRTTYTKPSWDLERELGRLSQIAAASNLLGITNLYNQAKNAYNNLVLSYNNQLPPEKKKGFWAQFKANITFTDLDRDFVIRLERLESSSQYQGDLDLMKIIQQNGNQFLVEYLNELLKRKY